MVKSESYEDDPVVIAEGYLLIEQKTHRSRLQLELVNTVNKALIACDISIICFNIANEPINETVSESFIEINAENGDVFGEERQIMLPQGTRHVDIIVKRVAFSDGTIWTNGETKTAEQRKQVQNIKVSDVEFDQVYRHFPGLIIKQNDDASEGERKPKYNRKPIKLRKVAPAIIAIVAIILLFVLILQPTAQTARDGFLKAMQDQGVPYNVAQKAANELEESGDFEGISFEESYKAGLKAAISMGY